MNRPLGHNRPQPFKLARSTPFGHIDLKKESHKKQAFKSEYEQLHCKQGYLFTCLDAWISLYRCRRNLWRTNRSWTGKGECKEKLGLTKQRRENAFGLHH